jgi:Zn-dependent alcohol dehydrogenase
MGRSAALISSGKLVLSELISDRLSLDEIGRAFEIRGHNGKMMVYPNGIPE